MQALSHSVQNKLLTRRGNSFMRVGGCCMQGFRDAQEDAKLMCAALPSHAHVAACGVFDGHNGAAAAHFAVDRLPVELAKLNTDSLFADTEAAHHQLESALLQIDAAFLQTPHHEAGATAVFCLMRREDSDSGTVAVTVAHAGDSRLLWIDGGDGACKFATVDHDPSSAPESRRICVAGGFVREGRVDGLLGVARALGDSPYKTADNAHAHKVIAVPDVAHLRVPRGDLLLLACDGIFEKLSNDEVAEFVATEMSLPDADPAIVAGRLVDKALQDGSRDNMSAIVVQFTAPSADRGNGAAYTRADDEFIAGPFYQFADSVAFRRCYEADAARCGWPPSRRLWEAAYRASLVDLERTVLQMRRRVANSDLSAADFVATCAAMRSELTRAFEADLARCS